jgi:hypothetical protein
LFGNSHFAAVLTSIDATRSEVVHAREIAVATGIGDAIVHGIFKRLVAAGLLRNPQRFDRVVSYEVNRPLLEQLTQILTSSNETLR